MKLAFRKSYHSFTSFEHDIFNLKDKRFSKIAKLNNTNNLKVITKLYLKKDK